MILQIMHGLKSVYFDTEKKGFIDRPTYKNTAFLSVSDGFTASEVILPTFRIEYKDKAEGKISFIPLGWNTSYASQDEKFYSYEGAYSRMVKLIFENPTYMYRITEG